MAESFDARKTWNGRSYTGMKVGRSHHWDYEGRWVERKIGPDLWDVDFTATKTRKGHGAPEGSGAPVGTEYLWMFAPTYQSARKMDANTYQTHLEGLKWKIGFRPATAKTWDYEWAKTGATARQRAIQVLEQTLADLKAQERAHAAALGPPALEGERPAPPAARKAKARTKGAKKKAVTSAHAQARAAES
jgi:hypothetical protein